METGRLGKTMENLISREEFDEFSQNQETKSLTLERELLSKIDENLENTRQKLKDFEQSKPAAVARVATGSNGDRLEVVPSEAVLSIIKTEMKNLGVSEIPKLPDIPTPDDVMMIVQSEIQKIWPIVDEIIVNAAIETKEKGMP